MSDLMCYVDGQIVPLAEATIAVEDLAVLRGYGVFDFLRTYHGQPFMLREHLLRLERSAQAIDLRLPCPLKEIEAIVWDTLRRNTLPEANIRLVVTGGVAPDGLTPTGASRLIVIITPPHSYPPHYYEQGVKVITVEIERCLPQAKTINYIPAIMALKRARAVGAVEALYTNRAGHILEGTTTNFFIMQDRQLITPVDDILPGISRDIILDLARDSVEVVERALTLTDVRRADEAFITASNKEMMPVRQLNDITIGEGEGQAPGPRTRRLMAQFRQVTWGEGINPSKNIEISTVSKNSF